MRNRDRNKAQSINKNRFQSGATGGMMLGSGRQESFITLGKDKKDKKTKKSEKEE